MIDDFKLERQKEEQAEFLNAREKMEYLNRYVSAKRKAIGTSEINILMNRQRGTSAPTAGLGWRKA